MRHYWIYVSLVFVAFTVTFSKSNDEDGWLSKLTSRMRNIGRNVGRDLNERRHDLTREVRELVLHGHILGERSGESVREQPLTRCHESYPPIFENDPQAPIISIPEVFRIGENNTVWVTAKPNTQLNVQMLFSLNADPILHTQNCYTLSISGNDRVAQTSTKQMDILFLKEYLPEDFYPHTTNNVHMIVRWQSGAGGWYHEFKAIKPRSTDKAFIETDKPVYKPEQTVTIRVYTLSGNLKPKSSTIEAYIMSPEGVVYQKDRLTEADMSYQIEGFHQIYFEFPLAPKYGQWRIKVKYGAFLSQEAFARFELQEYQLPTFSVEIEMPSVLPDSTEGQVEFEVITRHTYGENEPVHGSMECYGIINVNGIAPPFYQKWPEDGEVLCTGEDGSVRLEIDLAQVNAGMFGLQGEYLVVYCNVTEYFTDVQASGQAQAVFADEHYSVTFDRSVTYFTSGLPYVLQADVKMLHGDKPAAGIAMKMTILNWLNQTTLSELSVSSNRFGQLLHVLTDLPDRQIAIQLTINGVGGTDFTLVLSPGLGSAVKVVPQLDNQQLLHGIAIHASDFTSVKEMNLIFISKGEIKYQSKEVFSMFPRNGFIISNIAVSPDLHPLLSIVAFYTNSDDEQIMDVVTVPIPLDCKPQENIYTANITYEPRDQMVIDFKGFYDSAVAPMMMDNSALILGSHGAITNKKIKDSFKLKRSTCTPENSQQAFSQLDIIIFGNSLAQRCFSLRRKRSNSGDDEVLLPQRDEECCDWVYEKMRREPSTECQALTVQLIPASIDTEQLSQECITQAHHCCEQRKALNDRETVLPQVSHPAVDQERHPGLRRRKLISRVSSPDLFRRLSKGMAGPPGHADIAGRPGWEGLIGEAGPSGLPGYIRPIIKAEEVPVDAAIREPLLKSAQSGNSGAQVEGMPPPDVLRKFFPETIVMEAGKIGDQGRYRQTVTVPDSITSWNIRAVFMSPISGICIPEARNIHVVQDVFIRVSMPARIVMGEHFEMVVIVHNRRDQRIEADLTLNGVSSGLCFSGPEEDSVRVGANHRGYRHWYFIGTQAGEQNVTLTLRLSENNELLDSILQRVQVQHPGVQEVQKLATTVMGRSTGWVSDRENNVHLVLPPGTESIDGSRRAFVKLSGSIMGPSIDHLLHNVKGTKQRRSAKYVIRRLSSTLNAAWNMKEIGYLSNENKRIIKKHLKQGAKDLLSFKREDGSFSNAEKSESSIWITASAVKLMNSIEREFPGYTELYDNLVCDGAQWIMNHQGRRGEFMEPSRDSPRKMRNTLALTAYVTLALWDAQCHDESIRSRTRDVCDTALNYCRRNYRHADDYAKSYIAVARATHRYGSAHNYINDLMMRVARPVLRKSGDEVRPKDVEVVANTLMSVILNRFSGASGYANWLLHERNKQGEFKLYQDTVAGLEALAHYAVSQRENMNPRTCAITTDQQININNYDIIIDPFTTQHIEVSQHLQRELKIMCSGSAPVYSETFIQYNTMRTHPTCDYHVNVTIKEGIRDRRGGRGRRDLANSDICAGEFENKKNAKLYHIKTCVRHEVHHSISIEVDLKLITGHSAIEQSLSNARKQDHVRELNHNHDRTSIIAVMHLRRSVETCFTIRTQENQATIDNIQPASVSVTDESNGIICNTMYSLQNTRDIDAQNFLCDVEAVRYN